MDSQDFLCKHIQFKTLSNILNIFKEQSFLLGVFDATASHLALCQSFAIQQVRADVTPVAHVHAERTSKVQGVRGAGVERLV